MLKVDETRWYSVKEVSNILGWGVDSIRRWIRRGHLQAFRGPSEKKRGKRQFWCERVQGEELNRFIEGNLTVRR